METTKMCGLVLSCSRGGKITYINSYDLHRMASEALAGARDGSVSVYKRSRRLLEAARMCLHYGFPATARSLCEAVYPVVLSVPADRRGRRYEALLAAAFELRSKAAELKNGASKLAAQ